MTVERIPLELDHGDAKAEARRYARHNPSVSLADYLDLYPAKSREPLAEDHVKRPLEHFRIVPVVIPDTGAVDVRPPQAKDAPLTGALRRHLDALWDAELDRGGETEACPASVTDGEAVRVAYREELEAVARFLKNDLSVLITCDKVLTEHIWEWVCQQAGKTPVLDDAVPEGSATSQGSEFDRALQGGTASALPLLVRNLKPHEILVLRSIDLLDSPNLVQTLYQGASGHRKSQLLGFLDPSIEVQKVLADRFAVHVTVTGLPRYIRLAGGDVPTVTRLITAGERRRFRHFDPEGLYKNVSGLNAVQFRNAMRYIGATLEEDSEPRHIYGLIRQFKTSASDEIEIPETTFDDIGGYDRVKRELRRIIALVSGRLDGIDERQRARLIPRGFIFHGPPGTGKTLFAKAIANEMNATIQVVSGPEIMDRYVGQSESNLRRIFATARRNAPSIVLFDEFDSLASQRTRYSDGGARANNAVVAQLLTELDGFRADQTVLVIGTTNRLDIIDEALLRPSRMRPVEIGLPDHEARRKVAAIHAASFGIDQLLSDAPATAAEHSEGFNNDEIRAIFQEASLEHHLDGRTITPRYLVGKIDTIRRRRDERQVAHLSP